MAKRLTILLVALLALGFVIAGCGDDDDDNASDNTTTEQATTQDTTDDAGGGSAASGVAESPQVKQAIENCKEQANANPQLSDDAKKKVGEVCEEVGTGDADAATKATREACVIIVNDTVKQEGPAKQTALDACKQSTKTP
jgi:hypothetical protein